ncbi:MAG: isocitrate/isopropylmalate dehydrogenase family protein [Clostridia bacterium]|nr:isocitrate/isopropylmalate dehydrogenase family protein [Clostridia bacterium]
MKYSVVLIPGDGIGPEIAHSARSIIEASGVEIDWIVCEAGAEQIEKFGCALSPSTIEQIRSRGVALKGPITTPIGEGFRSLNVVMRKQLDLYANLRPAKSFNGVKTRYEDVNLVVVRENTEDLYAGLEHMINDDVAESIKVITRKGSERIVRFAFDYARQNGRKKVTAVHKANIMKMTDGLFLSVARQIAMEYPDIEFDDMIIDALCMRLVMNPADFDVMVMPNLYGDIVSDLAAGLVGGPGLAPSANIGAGMAIFEAVHGSAPQIAGKNIANPTALTLSGAMMLRHLGETKCAERIEQAIYSLIEQGVSTTDLGGKLSTSEYTDCVIKRVQAAR